VTLRLPLRMWAELMAPYTPGIEVSSAGGRSGTQRWAAALTASEPGRRNSQHIVAIEMQDTFFARAEAGSGLRRRDSLKPGFACAGDGESANCNWIRLKKGTRRHGTVDDGGK